LEKKIKKFGSIKEFVGKGGSLIGAMKKYFGTLNLSIKTFDRLMNPKSRPIKPQ
jgi:hypothetical protein